MAHQRAAEESTAPNFPPPPASSEWACIYTCIYVSVGSLRSYNSEESFLKGLTLDVQKLRFLKPPMPNTRFLKHYIDQKKVKNGNGKMEEPWTLSWPQITRWATTPPSGCFHSIFICIPLYYLRSSVVKRKKKEWPKFLINHYAFSLHYFYNDAQNPNP